MKVAKFGFALFGINTYVVSDGATGDCAVIDPGMVGAEEEEALRRYVERNGLRVTHVINTHLHVDHVVGDRFAKDLFHVPVSGHRADVPLGERIREQGARFGLRMRLDAVSLDSYLDDGDVVHVGEGRLEVLHVPGHSPGSIALYDPDGRYVITGDALFAGSIGRTDLPGGDYGQLIASIRKKLLALPDDTVVYPGHGPETTIGRERATNQFLK